MPNSRMNGFHQCVQIIAQSFWSVYLRSNGDFLFGTEFLLYWRSANTACQRPARRVTEPTGLR